MTPVDVHCGIATAFWLSADYGVDITQHSLNGALTARDCAANGIGQAADIGMGAGSSAGGLARRGRGVKSAVAAGASLPPSAFPENHLELGSEFFSPEPLEMARRFVLSWPERRL
jgi:hypothetical protein